MSDPWAFGWDQIAAFLNAGVILVAAWLGWRGVRNWRAERLDARQAEVAEQALILAYQAPEVFYRIRTVRGFVGEGSSRTPEPNETAEEKSRRDMAFVPIERIQKEARFFEQVSEIRPLVDAVFGNGHAEPFREFLRMRRDIIDSAHSLSELRPPSSPTEEQWAAHDAEVRQFANIIWYSPGVGGDFIEERLKNAVAEIEKVAGPLLESHLRRSPRP